MSFTLPIAFSQNRKPDPYTGIRGDATFPKYIVLGSYSVRIGRGVVAWRSSSMKQQGITFHRPFAFWTGAILITGGVVAHLPDFAAAAHMGFHMAGMPMSSLMMLGMVAIVVGLALATWGLVAPAGGHHRATRTVLHLRAIDDATLTGAHWGLLLVLGVALIIDVMKPATLAFVLPGMASEYGIAPATTAWLLVYALAGTTIGSLLWGVMADRIGRRAAILLASLMFIGTAICGTMPSFNVNLLMCFLMGLAAGGMLPIVYALMAESVPAGPRGWLVVLHGGMGTVGGTLAAAGCAALLEPTYSWRALWLINLPTGILMLILNRWIPESPRFLLQQGRLDEARAVMARYGVTIETEPAAENDEPPQRRWLRWDDITGLFQPPLSTQTTVVFVYGLAWGIVNWGFLSFLPTFLRAAGFGAGAASFLLFLSTIVAIPATVLVAYLYGRWSSRKSMVSYVVASVGFIICLAWMAPTQQTNKVAIVTLLALVYAATGGMIAMLSPYTAEVFPTSLRGTGSGLSAGGSKLGGLIGGVGALTGAVTISSGMLGPALLVSVPMVFAGAVMALRGIETRGRPLEELAGQAERPKADSNHARVG